MLIKWKFYTLGFIELVFCLCVVLRHLVESERTWKGMGSVLFLGRYFSGSYDNIIFCKLYMWCRVYSHWFLGVAFASPPEVNLCMMC